MDDNENRKKEEQTRNMAGSDRRLSLHPLSLEQALRGAAATGPYEKPADAERAAAGERVKDAARKSGQSSRGRNRRLRAEPNPDT